jgi:hypothetical protein
VEGSVALLTMSCNIIYAFSVATRGYGLSISAERYIGWSPTIPNPPLDDTSERLEKFSVVTFTVRFSNLTGKLRYKFVNIFERLSEKVATI